MKHFVIFFMFMLLACGWAWAQKPVDRAAILQDPEWKKVYDEYVPDAALIENLRSKAAEIKADVYFAFWCDDSRVHIPVFLKILDQVNVPEFRVNFFTVEKKAAPEQKYYVADLEIEKVPTFIFYINDFEMGRIIENPKNSILQDMMIIVF